MAGLFSKPKTPEVKPPAPMPDMNDPAVMAADRKRRAGMVAQGGRRSTLAGDGGGMVSNEYTQDKMG